MSSPPKNKPRKEPLTSKPRYFLLSMIRFVVSVYRNYLSLRIWAIVISLLIIIIIGDLLTKTGLLIVLAIVGYILLSYLDKWFEKHEEE